MTKKQLIVTSVILLLFIPVIYFVTVKEQINVNNGIIILDNNNFSNNCIKLAGSWLKYESIIVAPNDINGVDNKKEFIKAGINNNSFAGGNTIAVNIKINNINIKNMKFVLEIPETVGNYEVYFNGKNLERINSDLFLNNAIFPVEDFKSDNWLIIHSLNSNIINYDKLAEIKLGKYSEIFKARVIETTVIAFQTGVLFFCLMMFVWLLFRIKLSREFIYYILMIMLAIMLLYFEFSPKRIDQLEIYAKIAFQLKMAIVYVFYIMNLFFIVKGHYKKEIIYAGIIFLFFTTIVMIIPEYYYFLYIENFRLDSITILVAIFYLLKRFVKFLKKELLLQIVYYTTFVFAIIYCIAIFLPKSSLISAYIEILKLVLVFEYMYIVLEKIAQTYLDSEIVNKKLDNNNRNLEKIIEYKTSAIQKELKKWECFSKNAIECSLFINEEGDIIECNNAVSQIFESEIHSFIGKKIWDIEFRFTPEAEKTMTKYQIIKEKYETMLKMPILNSQKISRLKIETEHKKHKIVLLKKFSYMTDNGRIIGILGQDITKYENELHRFIDFKEKMKVFERKNKNFMENVKTRIKHCFFTNTEVIKVLPIDILENIKNEIEYVFRSISEEKDEKFDKDYKKFTLKMVLEDIFSFFYEEIDNGDLELVIHENKEINQLFYGNKMKLKEIMIEIIENLIWKNNQSKVQIGFEIPSKSEYDVFISFRISKINKKHEIFADEFINPLKKLKELTEELGGKLTISRNINGNIDYSFFIKLERIVEDDN